MKFNKKGASMLVVLAVLGNLVYPLNIKAYNSNLINIDFGEKLTQQEQNGYARFTGANMLENFHQAKAELPDEIPVIAPFDVCGQNEFFVQTDGDDNGTGSEDSPLATIKEALRRISMLSEGEKHGGSIIYLREGKYYAEEALNITDEHTSDNSTLFISAYPGENATVSAEKSISLKKAERVTEDNTDIVTLGRINKAAVGKLYFTTYEDMGLENIPYESIFTMNGMSMQVSRYPNQGTDTVDVVLRDGSYINGEGFTRTGLPMEWRSQDEKPFEWMDTGNIHIIGRVANEWSVTDGTAWFDDRTKTVKTTSAITPNYSPITTNFWGSVPSTYYYANVFEELDSFGEWFVDDAKKRFYFYLPDTADTENSFINYKKYKGSAFNVSDSSNVVFNGICISDYDSGVKVTNSENVVLQSCVINNIKDTAVELYNTEKCGITGSDIYDVKKSYAVVVSQDAEYISELVPRRNFVQNTRIGNVAQAINIVGSSGNIVSHNLIENTDYSAVNLNGAENIFEYNEFSGVANKITDAGGIYVGGDIKNRANTIRYNYFHDSRPDKKNARAIYNDDCSDMSWNYGNIVKNFSYGLFQHSGDDHVIMDNIVIDATTYIRNSANYSTQKDLMKNYFFQSSPQFIYNYNKYNLGNSETWQRRYGGIIDKKYEQVLSAKAIVDKNGSSIYDKVINVITGKKKASDYSNGDDIQKVCDLVADTGCYYIDNTYVAPGRKYSNGYGPSDYGLYNVTEPYNGGKPVVLSDKGFNPDSYINNIGLISDISEADEKPVIYMENKKEIEYDKFTGISWSESSGTTYYRAEIATDKEFDNVVVSFATPMTEYPVYTYSYDKDNDRNVQEKTSAYDFVNDMPYYARVTSVNLAKSAEKVDITSDTVEFILREKLDTKSRNAEGYLGDVTGKIKITGKLPDYLIRDIDKQITMMIYDGEEIKHIAQTEAAPDGAYSYVFSCEMTDTSKIRIRAGSDDITEDLLNNSVNKITEISFDGSIGEDGILTALARINNMFGAVDRFTITIASYDKTNKLTGCSTFDSKKLEISEIYELSGSYKIPAETNTVKAFLWDNNMKPLTEAMVK